MRFVQNFPFFCILLTLMCAVVSSVLSGKAARRVTLFVLAADTLMTACILGYTLKTGESFAFSMGHFPAPWGNEIRVGVMETLVLMGLMLVMDFAFIGGMKKSISQLEETKYNIFCILVDLTLLSLIALVYTNDIFTAYVFIEINTLAAAGLVMARQGGKSLVGGVRYLVMNLIGSSMFLLSIVVVYIVTGHLLMVNIRETIALLAADGRFRVPLIMAVLTMTVGLGMKSALYPFEKWLPGAYGNATPTAQAILSSIVSKGYIFLLIKIYYRVFGWEVIRSLHICEVIFVMGAAGMIMGSLNAIRAKTTRMMTAYSSVAQIGYIFLALGIGTEMGTLCALWHLVAHALTKSMLFLSGDVLDEASGGTHLRSDLRGAFYRSPLAAAAFAVGGANLVGVPLLPVFITKITMAQAAIQYGGKHMIVTLAVMALSTLLNTWYFLETASSFFSPREGVAETRVKIDRGSVVALCGLLASNAAMALLAGRLLPILQTALAAFV